MPNYFLWEDGHHYEIDRVLDIRLAALLRAGGIGLRYTIRVLGKQIYMWRNSCCYLPVYMIVTT